MGLNRCIAITSIESICMTKVHLPHTYWYDLVQFSEVFKSLPHSIIEIMIPLISPLSLLLTPTSIKRVTRLSPALSVGGWILRAGGEKCCARRGRVE